MKTLSIYFISVVLAGAQGMGFMSVSQHGFSPLTITNCQMWLDAGQIRGTNNQAVSQWLDLTGNNRTATNGAVANQPTNITGILNGRAVLRFDGTSDFLVLSNAVSSVTYYTLHLNKRAAAGSTAFGLVVSTNNTPYSGYESTPISFFHNRSLVVTGVLWSASWSVIASGSDLLPRRNGVLLPVVSITPTPNTANFDSIGKRNANFAAADFAEFLAFDRLLSLAEKIHLEQYLSRKWGVPFQ